MKKSTKVIFTIILILTILPYIGIVVAGIGEATYDYGNKFGNTPMEEFANIIIISIRSFSFPIPFLPLCLVYQVLYIILMRKEKLNKNK